MLPMQNADPWIEVDGGITPANAYKVLEPIFLGSQLVTRDRNLNLQQATRPIERASQTEHQPLASGQQVAS